MRYGLRTLLIIFALAPLAMALAFWLAEPYLTRHPSERLIQMWLKMHKDNPYSPRRPNS